MFGKEESAQLGEVVEALAQRRNRVPQHRHLVVQRPHKESLLGKRFQLRQGSRDEARWSVPLRALGEYVPQLALTLLVEPIEVSDQQRSTASALRRIDQTF